MSPRFRPGDRVRVRATRSPGHQRTPGYIKGLAGEVERVCGPFANPEELAYGRPGLPKLPLYRVRFRQAEVWPGYDGAPDDAVEIELYEHWLDPA